MKVPANSDGKVEKFDVSKKTSKKRIESLKTSLPTNTTLSQFQRKPQKRGLKVLFNVISINHYDNFVSKKTSKKRIESLFDVGERKDSIH